MLEAYKNEIVQAEKDRNELFKWKLILVAVLSAVSLGIGDCFSSNSSSNIGDYRSSNNSFTHLAVCLIPLVCAYVDLLCKHLQIRILVVSKFFQECEVDTFDKSVNDTLIFKKYEKYCEDIRSAFSFEDWAQTWSTYFLCGLVICLAFYELFLGNKCDFVIILVSSIIGITLTILIDYSFNCKKKKLNSTIKDSTQGRSSKLNRDRIKSKK